MPWFPCDTTHWPEIAEAIAGRWPEAAAHTDLRWWADQTRMGFATSPSSRALAARWGWGRFAVETFRKKFATEADPRGPATHQPLTSHPPASAKTLDANNSRVTSHPPATHQPPTSQGRAKHNDSTPLSDTITEHRTQNTLMRERRTRHSRSSRNELADLDQLFPAPTTTTEHTTEQPNPRGRHG